MIDDGINYLGDYSQLRDYYWCLSSNLVEWNRDKINPDCCSIIRLMRMGLFKIDQYLNMSNQKFDRDQIIGIINRYSSVNVKSARSK